MTYEQMKWIGMALALAGVPALAQTTVTTTTGGTVTTTPQMNTIPMFTTGSNIENSRLGQGVNGNIPAIRILGANLWIGDTSLNGGVAITTGQPVTTTVNGVTTTTYYSAGYRFGQDSVVEERGLYYDQQTSRISLMNIQGSSQTAQTVVSEHVTVLPNGHVGINTITPGASLEVSGNAQFDNNLTLSNSSAAITFGDGTQQTTAWTGVLCGGDYAESVDVVGDRKRYSVGDVLVIDTDAPGKFLLSAEPYSTSVMGVYSTKPGALGRRQTTPKSAEEIPMAMIGIVPTKVTTENGPIKPGDLLVTSSTVGYAMKGTDRNRMLGAVIGKALGRLDSGAGVIEVGIVLQ